MQLDPHIYEQVRQTRDPRYDGRLFIGVLTTGIYCRPICPVRVPRQENVLLYTSAAEAAEAGFRPCLRCRPESAPGTPGQVSANAIVNQALAQIGRGVPGDLSVQELAGDCGVSTRQLNRLFRQYVGASPLAIAQTRRLHFAKKLIDETTLPMSDVCFAAGFNSVRRFNTVIRNTWQRSPLQLRKVAQQRQQLLSEPEFLSLNLSYRPPFDWRTMLDFLAYRAIPGVEQVSPATGEYARTLSVNGVSGIALVQFMQDSRQLCLRLSTGLAPQLFIIAQRFRQMFDLDASSDEIDRHLGADPLLKPIIDRYPGVRVPVAWEGFEVAVRAIIGQQVSVKAAATLVSRLVQRFGRPLPDEVCNNRSTLNLLFPEPADLQQADLSGLGITGGRIQAIQALSGALVTGEIRLDGTMATPEVIARLCDLRGIGAWTAQYIALRALNDPDAFPAADLILLRAAGTGGIALTPRELLARSQAWQPWRAYAVMSLWHDYSQNLQKKPEQQGV